MSPDDFEPTEYMHDDALVRVRRVGTLSWAAEHRESEAHPWRFVAPATTTHPNVRAAIVAAIRALGLEDAP